MLSPSDWGNPLAGIGGTVNPGTTCCPVAGTTPPDIVLGGLPGGSGIVGGLLCSAPPGPSCSGGEEGCFGGGIGCGGCSVVCI